MMLSVLLMTIRKNRDGPFMGYGYWALLSVCLKLLKKENIQQILIAVPSANGDQIRRIVEACQQM